MLLGRVSVQTVAQVSANRLERRLVKLDAPENSDSTDFPAFVSQNHFQHSACDGCVGHGVFIIEAPNPLSRGPPPLAVAAGEEEFGASYPMKVKTFSALASRSFMLTPFSVIDPSHRS